MFTFPTNACLDNDGNLLVSDQLNHAIRLINLQNDIVKTLAGSGKEGFADGPADKAQFNFPAGIVCVPDGTIYVCDYYNNQIRCIDLKSNTVGTLAGSKQAGHADEIGEKAKFHSPVAIVHRDGFLYVSDCGNHCIRSINVKTRQVTTIAGISGKEGFKDDPASQAQFYFPQGLALDPAGNLLVCDYKNHRIRHIDLKTEIVSTFAGNGERKTVDGPADKASFYQPYTIVCDSAGSLFIYQSDNTVRKYDPKTGM